MATRELDLIGRDEATASLLGLLPGQGSSSFGSDFGYDPDFGDDFGADAAAAQTAVAAQRQQARDRILNPNKGSALKVEQYLMALASVSGVDPTWGVAVALNFSDNPKVAFRPQRIITNVEFPGLYVIADISVTNLQANIGTGRFDATWLGSRAVATRLDFPTIQPSQRITVTGQWGTFVPPAYVPGTTFPVTVGAIGPAHMAGS